MRRVGMSLQLVASLFTLCGLFKLFMRCCFVVPLEATISKVGAMDYN